jgi:hypothetical protein
MVAVILPAGGLRMRIPLQRIVGCALCLALTGCTSTSWLSPRQAGVGMSRAAALQCLGKPAAARQEDSEETFTYASCTIRLVAGYVVDTCPALEKCGR